MNTRFLVCALFAILALFMRTPLGMSQPEVSQPKKTAPKKLPPLIPSDKEPVPEEIVPAQATEKLNVPPIEAKKSYDVILVAPASGTAVAAGDVFVGFFNHSSRDLELEINKRPLKLGSHYYVQVKVPREFTWKEKDGPVQTIKVPADADGAEIVFRK